MGIYLSRRSKNSAIKPLFSKHISSEITAVLLIVLSVSLMVLDRSVWSVPLKKGLSLVSSSLQYLYSIPSAAFQWSTQSLTRYTTMQSENKLLKQENLALKAQLQTKLAILQENERLHKMLGSSSPFANRVEIAEIIATLPDPLSHRVTLNKGERESVYVGQTISDAYGIVGQVTRVHKTTSEALFITDPHHAIPAQSLRNGARVLVMGMGALNQLEVPFVSDSNLLKVGDLLVTSSLGKRFPPGYPVATITSITRETEQPFLRVQAKPLARLDRLDEVLLIWPKENIPSSQKD